MHKWNRIVIYWVCGRSRRGTVPLSPPSPGCSPRGILSSDPYGWTQDVWWNGMLSWPSDQPLGNPKINGNRSHTNTVKQVWKTRLWVAWTIVSGRVTNVQSRNDWITQACMQWLSNIFHFPTIQLSSSVVMRLTCNMQSTSLGLDVTMHSSLGYSRFAYLQSTTTNFNDHHSLIYLSSFDLFNTGSLHGGGCVQCGLEPLPHPWPRVVEQEHFRCELQTYTSRVTQLSVYIQQYSALVGRNVRNVSLLQAYNIAN